jgi:DNA repair photolyase
MPLRLFRPSKGYMFKSVDYTFTYYQGCGSGDTLYPCPVCWARWLPWGEVSHEARKLWDDPDTLIPPSIKGTIFLNSAHDRLAPRIPEEWIREMLHWIGRQHPGNSFYLQSKFLPRTRLFHEELYPLRNRVILGTTLMTTDQHLLNQYGFKVSPVKALYKDLGVHNEMGFRVRVSLEPLYKFAAHQMASMVRMLEPEVVEIGLDNYRHRHRIPIPGPSRESVQLLLGELRGLAGTRVVLKKGLHGWLNEPEVSEA